MVAKGRAIDATQVARVVEIVEMGGFSRGDWGLEIGDDTYRGGRCI